MSLQIHKRHHCRVPRPVGPQLPVPDRLGEWALMHRPPDADLRPFPATVKFLCQAISDLERPSCELACRSGGRRSRTAAMLPRPQGEGVTTSIFTSMVCLSPDTTDAAGPQAMDGARDEHVDA
jgi:hypothetical protein